MFEIHNSSTQNHAFLFTIFFYLKNLIQNVNEQKYYEHTMSAKYATILGMMSLFLWVFWIVMILNGWIIFSCWPQCSWIFIIYAGFMANWFVALQSKSTHYFVKRSLGRQFVGKDTPRNPRTWKPNTQWWFHILNWNNCHKIQ